MACAAYRFAVFPPRMVERQPTERLTDLFSYLRSSHHFPILLFSRFPFAASPTPPPLLPSTPPLHLLLFAASSFSLFPLHFAAGFACAAGTLSAKSGLVVKVMFLMDEEEQQAAEHHHH